MACPVCPHRVKKSTIHAKCPACMRMGDSYEAAQTFHDLRSIGSATLDLPTAEGSFSIAVTPSSGPMLDANTGAYYFTVPELKGAEPLKGSLLLRNNSKRPIDAILTLGSTKYQPMRLDPSGEDNTVVTIPYKSTDEFLLGKVSFTYVDAKFSRRITHESMNHMQHESMNHMQQETGNGASDGVEPESGREEQPLENNAEQPQTNEMHKTHQSDGMVNHSDRAGHENMAQTHQGTEEIMPIQETRMEPQQDEGMAPQQPDEMGEEYADNHKFGAGGELTAPGIAIGDRYSITFGIVANPNLSPPSKVALTKQPVPIKIPRNA